VFRDAFPIVYARDLPRSLLFYRDALGFEPRYRWPPEGVPDFVVLRLGGFELALSDADAPERLLGRRMGADLRFELCVYTDDVDRAVARLRDAGVPVLRKAEDMPWGERMAYVADPDGNPVQVTARG
jgi:lactoylglutathione lyase